MGLDAVVYRHRRNIPERFGRVRIEPATGEAMPARDGDKDLPNEVREACHRRLGNLDLIVNIRVVLEKILRNPKSELFTRVLYSALHSGDVIPVDKLAPLKSELEFVKQSIGALSAQEFEWMDRFVEAMEELISVAEAEANPIVFT